MTNTASRDNRRLALVVLCAGMLMIILDSTIVNVALPAIQEDLGFSQTSLAWVVNAYLIAFGGLLLLAGRLGDLTGSRRIFLAGLAVFTAASLVCGLAQSQEALIAARFVQGVGGALTSGVILGMIVTMFPQPREQAQAIGIYAFVASAGASIGLLAGGALTQWINWHWIFFVNLPIGIATALLALRLVANDRGIGIGRATDVLGAVLVTAALMLGVYTILEAGDQGWASTHTLGFGAASLALLAAFVHRQATTRNPLVPLRIFRSRNVAGANVVQMLMVSGLFGMFFLGVLYMQRLLGYDAIDTGLAFLPVAVLIGALSLGVSARLNMRFGARATLVPGLVLVAAGLVLFTRAPLGASYVTEVLPVMLLLGTGAGLVFPSLTTLAMSGATPGDAGLAGGLLNTSLQVGGALGLAVLAALSTG
ncbi:MAG: DHA2 family efflux MFS transporter permease subunit, partial [Solirubrobacteraceae bacterium]